MIKTDRLLSATDIIRACGISREGLRQMRRRGAAPPAQRVGGVSITTLDDFVGWIARELSRVTRPRWMRQLARPEFLWGKEIRKQCQTI